MNFIKKIIILSRFISWKTHFLILEGSASYQKSYWVKCTSCTYLVNIWILRVIVIRIVALESQLGVEDFVDSFKDSFALIQTPQVVLNICKRHFLYFRGTPLLKQDTAIIISTVTKTPTLTQSSTKSLKILIKITIESLEINPVSS